MKNIFCNEIAKVAILAIVGVLFSFPTFSQDNGVKKVYSGELNLRDMQNWRKVSNNGIEISWNVCRGSYQYISSTDGGRIFDGSFNFKTKTGHKVVGEFLQNKQVGLWEYQYSSGDTTKINFVDGIPQGPFIVHNPSNVGVLYKGTIQNGKLYSYFVMHYPGVTMTGYYNRDGKPIGKWNIWIDGKNYTSEYDNNGNKQEGWCRVDYDESTGDKSYVYCDVGESPEGARGTALDFISMYTLRDSKLK